MLYKNYSHAEVIILNRFNKTTPFLWNTKNTDKNRVNDQKINTPDTRRKIDEKDKIAMG